MTSQTIELTTTMTTDEIETLAKLDRDEGDAPTVTLYRQSRRVFGQIVTGDEGVVLTAADGGVFIGDISDYDDHRMEVTVGLR